MYEGYLCNPDGMICALKTVINNDSNHISCCFTLSLQGQSMGLISLESSNASIFAFFHLSSDTHAHPNTKCLNYRFVYVFCARFCVNSASSNREWLNRKTRSCSLYPKGSCILHPQNSQNSIMQKQHLSIC